MQVATLPCLLTLAVVTPLASASEHLLVATVCVDKDHHFSFCL